MRQTHLFSAAAAALCLFAGLFAQPTVLKYTSSVNGPVYAMTTWDPDGPGPLGDWLVVGGEFTLAVGVPARNIAA